MDDRFKIFVERLKTSGPERIQERLPPAFVEIEEEGLLFEQPIEVNGEALVAGALFILSASLTTVVKMPCAICNTLCDVPLHVERVEHVENVDAVRSGVYNVAPLFREALLLELPARAECEGSCPARAEMQSYLSKGRENFPFQNLGEE